MDDTQYELFCDNCGEPMGEPIVCNDGTVVCSRKCRKEVERGVPILR